MLGGLHFRNANLDGISFGLLV